VVMLISGVASAGDPSKVDVTPHLQADVANTDTDVKAGIQIADADGQSHWLLRLLGDVPFGGDKSQQEAQLDAQTNTWKITAAGRYTYVVGDYWLSVGLNGSWGRAPFSFYPNGGAKQTRSHNSYTGTAEFLIDHEELKPKAIGLTPQLRVDFARAWSAADPVAVVSDMSMPGIVPVEIVSPPTKNTTLSFRGSFLGTKAGTNWGAGASARYLRVGAKNDASPLDGYSRLRLEVWGYYFFEGKPTNTRLGFAPFFDAHISEAGAGLDKGDKYEYGVLVQLRVGTILREY